MYHIVLVVISVDCSESILIEYLKKFVSQELRCKEEELTRMQLQQKQYEEDLQKREQELRDRELDVLGREINIIMTQTAPTPFKRRGKFSKTKLKVDIFEFLKERLVDQLSLQLLKKAPGQISFPLDFRHTITVQHTALQEAHLQQVNTPPGSPANTPRLRAIAREF